MTKCKNCGADEGLHSSMTDQCPVGVESLYHPIVDGNNTVEHLTIRQHFAGLAMQGLCVNIGDGIAYNVIVAEDAVEMADALIAELNKTNE